MSDGSVRPYLCLAWPAVRCAPPVAGKFLQKHLQCSRATLRRIIEDMRAFLGAPIDYLNVHSLFLLRILHMSWTKQYHLARLHARVALGFLVHLGAKRLDVGCRCILRRRNVQRGVYFVVKVTQEEVALLHALYHR